MATTQDFIEFVCGQIARLENVRYKKMMGEYLVYVDDRSVFTVCDNTVYVKKLPCIESLMIDADCGVPYKGAKECYILDIDDSEKATEAARLLALNTPPPKKK